MSSEMKIVEDFNKFLDIATNPMQLEPDAVAVAKICMIVDKLLVEPNAAIQAIHGKILDENPHTVDFALTVLNTVFYKCGNLVHSVIVTPEYMELIKDIIQSTEHTQIKDKIMFMLVDWADKFKYFPNYSAVQELLKELSWNDCKENGRNLTTEKLQDNNGNNPSTTCQNSVVNKKIVKANNNCIKNDSNVCMDEKLNEREQEFKRQLKERRDKKEREYKLHRKELGLPTSSDENDISDEKNITAKKQELNVCKIGGSESKKGQCKQKSIKLTKELEKKRSQRLTMNADVKEIRSVKRENFRKYRDNDTYKMRQCTGRNCENCESYKNKNRQEQHTVIPKHLPKEMKKVKESRELLNNSVKDCKQSKHEEYIKKHSNNSSNWKYKNVPTNSIMGEEEFEKDLQKALLLSKECSLVKSRPLSDQLAMDPTEYDDLQRAMNLSLQETQEQIFSPMPELDESIEDLQLKLAKQLSLEMESKQVKDYLGSKKNCAVCFDTKPAIKMFLPCKHRCICNDCTLIYPLAICPVCRQDWTEISD